MADANCLPVPEAARRLGVSPQRVRQLLDGGELAPMFFSNGRRFVSEASLRRLIAEREARKAAATNSSSSSKTKAGK